MKKFNGRINKIEREISKSEVGHTYIASLKYEELGLDLIDRRIAQLSEKVHSTGRLTRNEQHEYRALLDKLQTAVGPGIRVTPPRGVRITSTGVERNLAEYGELIEAAKRLGWRGGDHGNT